MDAPWRFLYQSLRPRLNGVKGGRMKITMNVECTPEEARRFMGLPDMAPIHDLYLDKLRETMTEGLTPETIDRMIRTWTPMGEVGMNAWRQMIDQMTGSPKG
jgi:hypothetical protein